MFDDAPLSAADAPDGPFENVPKSMGSALETGPLASGAERSGVLDLGGDRETNG